jgi:hypothetical protein
VEAQDALGLGVAEADEDPLAVTGLNERRGEQLRVGRERPGQGEVERAEG